MNKQDMTTIRKWAGLPVLSEATNSHESKENTLFSTAYQNMEDVLKMSKDRLAAGDLSDEHKSQYEELVECASKCCKLLQAHMDSYKK